MRKGQKAGAQLKLPRGFKPRVILVHEVLNVCLWISCVCHVTKPYRSSQTGSDATNKANHGSPGVVWHKVRAEGQLLFMLLAQLTPVYLCYK